MNSRKQKSKDRIYQIPTFKEINERRQTSTGDRETTELPGRPGKDKTGQPSGPKGWAREKQSFYWGTVLGFVLDGCPEFMREYAQQNENPFASEMYEIQT